jgi:hypothetical protein
MKKINKIFEYLGLPFRFEIYQSLDLVNDIVEKNKDKFESKFKKSQVSKKKFCSICKKDLEGYIEGKGEKVQPGEYWVWQSIEPGKEGSVDLNCYECLVEHLANQKYQLIK